ncbi:MAG: aspartate-semialdehyde dehydrogenase [Candidatus Kapaibacterium sp.]
MGNKPITAIVGASGLVGRKMAQILEERDFPCERLLLFASERSAGQKIAFRGGEIEILPVSDNSFEGVDIALFSAGGAASKQYAPIAAKAGCVVIDNSSAWRMNPGVPLVVPEVNPEALASHKGIIANPNCSTIQMVVALKPIEDELKLSRVIVSTYQSISGAGQKGIDRLKREMMNPGQGDPMRRIALNANFHEITDPAGFTVEELKMRNETRKILNNPLLRIAVTCVRLPIMGGHGESVNFETEAPFDLEKLINILTKKPGLVIMDDPINQVYPTPAVAEDRDEVFVGRLRIDHSARNSGHMWIVADNVRKGAATNAIRIAEELIRRDLLKFPPGAEF